MLTEKMRAVREVIEIGIERDACPQVAGILNVASENVDEVLEWLRLPSLHAGRGYARKLSDAVWPNSPDNKNPNSVAVNVINHINQEFINHGVKFVVAVGDLTDNGSILALDTRATFTQALYNAGIGFYPLRGNHESSKTGAIEFQRIFPQTQTGVNNQTPADALVTTTYYGAPPANTNTRSPSGRTLPAHPRHICRTHLFVRLQERPVRSARPVHAALRRVPFRARRRAGELGRHPASDQTGRTAMPLCSATST